MVPHELLTLDIWDAIIVVAGGRNFNDDDLFAECLEERLMREDLIDLPRIVFVSGKAKQGADDMIIRWCQENHFPYAEYPADWEGQGRGAGYARNAQMARVMTHLITFWDGESRGTRDMILQAHKRQIRPTINLVDPDPDWIEKTTRKKLTWQEIDEQLKRQSSKASKR